MGIAALGLGWAAVAWALTPVPCPPQEYAPVEIEVVSGTGLSAYVEDGQRACLVMAKAQTYFEIVPCDAEIHTASKWIGFE